MMNDGFLKNVELKNDSEKGYYLCVTYETKDKYDNIHEEIIDKVPLPLYTNPLCISSKKTISFNQLEDTLMDIGYGDVHLFKDTKIIDKIVKYAEKEMTIEEIEKKLGHKVKIVNKKEV